MWHWVLCMPLLCLFPEFFDITNRNCTRAFTFTDMDSCPLVMDYW